ncbi:MAG: GNAT family N-acetyltransferase [Lysobacterales bacterium]
MNIEVSHEENPEVFEALISELRKFNMSHMGNEKSKPLSVVATDDSGNLIGGVSGRTIYNQFLIELLWVGESSREQGLGRNLMVRAESEARARGCLAAQVDTLSFQAPNFYQKLGFEIAGKVSGIPNSPERFFLVKRYG